MSREPDERKLYEEKMDAQLRDWDIELNQLKRVAEAAPDREKTEYDHKVEELRILRNMAKSKLEDLRRIESVRYAEAQNEMDGFWKTMKRSLEKLKNKAM